MIDNRNISTEYQNTDYPYIYRGKETEVIISEIFSTFSTVNVITLYNYLARLGKTDIDFVISNLLKEGHLNFEEGSLLSLDNHSIDKGSVVAFDLYYINNRKGMLNGDFFESNNYPFSHVFSINKERNIYFRYINQNDIIDFFNQVNAYKFLTSKDNYINTSNNSEQNSEGVYELFIAKDSSQNINPHLFPMNKPYRIINIYTIEKQINSQLFTNKMTLNSYKISPLFYIKNEDEIKKTIQKYSINTDEGEENEAWKVIQLNTI